jgi:hypothetical protein
MTLEDGQPSQGHADDARSLRSPDAAGEAAGPAAGAPIDLAIALQLEQEATVNASLRRCGQLRQAVLRRAFECRLVPAPPEPTAPPTMPEHSP